MAFAGTFGAAAALIPFGILSSKQYGAGISYDANGNLQFRPGNTGGTLITPEVLNDLFINASGGILLALADNTDTGAAADTGVLATGAPAANQHGLPANFGPGRGAWVAADLGSLRVTILEAINTITAVTQTGGPVVRSRTLAAANVAIAIKNMSEVTLASGLIRVQWEHSIQP